MTDAEARELAGRLETLLERLSPDATDAVAALVELYGEGLARIAARVGPDVLAGDEVVEHLLMVHGLHPRPLAERVQAALDEVRPYLRSHGGEVELVGVDEGVVRLRLEGSCAGCPASQTTLELAVEESVRRAAPEVERFEVHDGEPSALDAAFSACPLPMAPQGAA